MYFWHIEELKSNIIAAPLTEREVIPYFLSFLLAYEFVSWIPSSPTANVLDYATNAYGLALTLFGTFHLYHRNGGNAGTNFVQRYLAIGWVTTIRVIAGGIPAFIALRTIFSLQNESDGFVFGFTVVFGLVLYQRFGKHIHDVAVNDKAI